MDTNECREKLNSQENTVLGVKSNSIYKHVTSMLPWTCISWNLVIPDLVVTAVETEEGKRPPVPEVQT